MTASLQRMESGFDRGDGHVCLPPAGLSGRVIDAMQRKQRVALASAIESHIVPRLVVARAAPAPVTHLYRDPAHNGVSQDVLDVIGLAIGHDDSAVRLQIEDRLRRQSLEQVCFDLLTPAACHLGHMWDEDLCSMADVTLGVMRLQSGLHAAAVAARATLADGFRRHRILLAPVPGEFHTFGLTAVSMFFERAGWSVTRSQRGLLPEMTALLRREWFGVLGISVGSEAQLPILYEILPRLREASRNSALAVIVGGPIFVGCPDLARQVGADATAADGVQATFQAENLLAAGPVHG